MTSRGDYSSGELYATAQENAIAFALVGLAYIKEQGGEPQDLIQLAGKRIAPSWKVLQKHGAADFLRTIAQNIAALGGEVQSFSGDETQARATFSDWIHPQQASSYGLTREEADIWWDVFLPIAESIDLHYQWQRNNNTIDVTISR